MLNNYIGKLFYSSSKLMSPNATDEKLAIQPTGIVGLDTVLQGGLPKGATIILAGAAGTGKTVLCHQWLFEGFTKYNEPGLYIALSESVSKAQKNCFGFAYCKKEALHPLGVHFTDLRSIIDGLNLDGKADLSNEDTDRVIEVIVNLVREMNAKRVVLDSITALLYLLKDPHQMRTFIFKLGNILSQINATVILTSEVIEKNRFSVFGVEEFIADGIIYTSNTMGEQSMVRRLQVIKMRGLDFRSGEVTFEIQKEGIKLFPKIPLDRTVAKTEFSVRLGTGISVLDNLLDGGYPQGHMMLFAGNSGSGKSTFGYHFLLNGIEKGEVGLIICLEESSTQIKKTALEHSWDFQKAEDEGMLYFIDLPLIDIYPDKLLYKVVALIEKNNIKRVVIDSASSLQSATMNQDKLREFLLQIATYFKTKGVTCLMTYLSDIMFGGSGDQLLTEGSSSHLRLSSIVDGIIILRYVEDQHKVKKIMNILKLRGSKHDTSILEFTAGPDGITIGDKFKT